MNSANNKWLRLGWLWWVPLALVVVCLLFIVLFHTTFAGQVEAIDSSVNRSNEVLEDIRQAQISVDSMIVAIDQQDASRDLLYERYFSTEDERFTTALREIRTLARSAGLNPSSFSYPKGENEDHQLIRRGINFSVEGTYENLRTFINLLELNEQFFTLEAVGLGGGQADRNPTLKIGLSLSTMFTDVEAPIDASDIRGASLDVDDAIDPGSPTPELIEIEAEPVQAEPVQAEPIQAEPVQAEPIQAEEET